MSQPTPEPTTSTETPLAYRVVRGGFWLAASSYFNIGVGFLATLVLTRLIDPASFGAYALAVFFFSMLDIRPKIGITFGFEQRRHLDGHLIGTHLLLDVALGVASLAIALLAGPALVALGYSRDVANIVLALAGVGLIDSVTTTATSTLARELRFRTVSVVQSAVFPISYIPGLWLAFSGAGYWALVAQAATNSALLLIGMWWAMLRHVRTAHSRWAFDRKLAGELVRFGLPLGTSGYAHVLTLQFDNFLIGTVAGQTVLGFYDRAFRVAQWPMQVVSVVVNRVAFLAYARLQDDPERMQTTMRMMIWLTTGTTLPLSVAIFASAPDLVRLVFGEAWLPSVPFLRVLVAYSVLRPLLDNAMALLVGSGRPTTSAKITVIQAGVLVAVGGILAILWGAMGTAVAVGISFAVAVFVAYRYLARNAEMLVRSEILYPLVAAACAIVLHLVLVRLVPFDDWPLVFRVVVKAAYAGIAFYVIAWLLRPRLNAARVQYVLRLARGRAG